MARAGEGDGDGEGRSGRKSYPLYDSPLLKAGARCKGGRVKVDACGPLAHLPLDQVRPADV